MNNEVLYVIKGTGLVLDGTIVTIVETVGDYNVVSPPNLPTPVSNIMVKTKCLQPIGDVTPILYTFTVTKYENYKLPETQVLEIRNAIRNVDLNTIIEFLDKTISPILRME